MEAALLKSVLSGTAPDADVVIKIERPGSIGGTPCVAVTSLNVGFDWDNGKLILVPQHPLTMLTAEDVAAIRESVSKGQSWHAYEAHKKQKALIDSYKVDAERHRFGREVMTNTDLQNSLAPLLDEWTAKTPEATTAEEHDAQADHMIAVARAAGLWPIKTEGEAA